MGFFGLILLDMDQRTAQIFLSQQFIGSKYWTFLFEW